MSIFDSHKYKTIFHDFDFLSGCFGNTRVMPTDIDGIIERNSNFLVMEFKPEGKRLSTGQRIMLERMSKIDVFTVLVIWHTPCEMHEPKVPTSIQAMPSKELKKVDVQEVRKIVCNWWDMANNSKRSTNETN